MKTFSCLLLLILMIDLLPVAAQDNQCIEYGSFDWVNNVSLVHQVNLDTGAVATYPQSDSRVTPDANDEPFTAGVIQNSVTRSTYQLSLTDNRTGIRIVLAPVVTTYQSYWSPDGVFLAYVELERSQNVDTPYLRFFNTETGAILSTLLEGESLSPFYVHLIWSANSDLIAARLTFNMEDARLGSEVRVYSVPGLTQLMTYRLEGYPSSVYWSPSGNHLAIVPNEGDVRLVETSTWGIYTVDVQDIRNPPEFLWSPDDTYLAMVSSSNDHAYDNFAVVNMQGAVVIDTMLINRLGTVYWIDDSHLLIPTDDTPTHEGEYYDFDYDLTLFDLQTGEQSLVIEQAGSYQLSSDHRYLVEISNTEQFIKIYDLSQSDELLIDSVTVEESIRQYLWRSDRLEFIVLFEDMSLRAYDLETQTWRTIATDIPHPGDDVGIYQAACTQ